MHDGYGDVLEQSFPKYGSRPKQGRRNLKNWVGRAKRSKNESYIFHVSMYVCNGDTCEKSIFLTLKGNSVIYSQNSSMQSLLFHMPCKTWVVKWSPNSELGRAQKGMGNAVI